MNFKTPSLFALQMFSQKKIQENILIDRIISEEIDVLLELVHKGRLKICIRERLRIMIPALTVNDLHSASASVSSSSIFTPVTETSLKKK